MKNKLAIVIPYYKIDFFEQTLQSIAQQTDIRFSLYIGNDASSNNPLPLIQKYFKEGEYYYFNYHENLGGKNLAMQWERILENVKEEWFQILGDDDIIADNFVEEFYKSITEIEQKNINIIKVSQAFINDYSELTTTYSQYPRIITTQYFWEIKFNLGHRSSLSEHIFRMSYLNKNRFVQYPLAWHTDDMAVIEFAALNGIFFISKAKVHVRLSDLSISGNLTDTKNNDLKEYASYLFYGDVLNNYISLLGEKNTKILLEKYLNRIWRMKQNNKVNLLSIYFYLKEYKKILTIPYKNILFYKNAKKN